MRFAAINLQNCLDIINKMESDGQQVQAWTAYEDSWNRAVFGLDVPWSGLKSPNGGVDVHGLNSLLSLSAVIQVYMPKLEEDGLESLRSMLDSEILKRPAKNYPYELQSYLIRVRDHLEWCVENFDKVGEFELHNAAMQFRMTVLFMAATSPSENDTKDWGEFIRERFVWPFITTTVTSAPSVWAMSELGELGRNLLEILPK
ncbi:hypothetical protein [Corynebacterium callunae]|uniref:hypothetical protein n=1 Tax=Corynebacterium callunae TaxID=1721 RepID=UPI0020001A48|nr:hypothetical protein [Corynebacterium callunae]MCK2200215.1 hypothetical protein [Corynebacterium callunae]